MAEQAVDASVAIKWVVKGEPFRNKARKLLRDAQASGTILIGPPLLLYELESTLQRSLLRGAADLATTDASLGAFYRAAVQIHTHVDMVVRARVIAHSCRQERIYDSIYAALTELRGCELWTADQAFYAAVKTSLPFVKYLADYP